MKFRLNHEIVFLSESDPRPCGTHPSLGRASHNEPDQFEFAEYRIQGSFAA